MVIGALVAALFVVADAGVTALMPVFLVVALVQLAVLISNVRHLSLDVVLTESTLRLDAPFASRVVRREEVETIHVRWLGRAPRWLDAEARVTVVTRSARKVRFLFRRVDVDRDSSLAQAWPELLRSGPRV